jgi:hypothetical protein
VSITLTHEERDVVRGLQDTGMSLQEATLAVIMLTRGHARPEKDLIDIIDVYPALNNKYGMQQAIHTLQNAGWLVTSPSFGQTITKAASDLSEKIADRIHDQTRVQQMMQSNTQSAQIPPSNIRLLGPMVSEHVYGTFLDLLGNAHTEICLPMLVTPPYESTVSILQEQAHKGIHIRILLASPDVAKQIRGEVVVDKARKAIKDWQEVARGHPKIEIRVTHQVEDMCHMATSWTLDRRILRYDFYDPKNQRSLAGYMIEFDSHIGASLNIVSLFQARFDEAWNHAQPLNMLGLWWRLKKNWQWGAFVLTALIAIPFGTSIWGGIIGSVSATFLFNALVSSSSMIKATIRKLIR